MRRVSAVCAKPPQGLPPTGDAGAAAGDVEAAGARPTVPPLALVPTTDGARGKTPGATSDGKLEKTGTVKKLKGAAILTKKTADVGGAILRFGLV